MKIHGCFDYITDKRNCNNRKEIVRYFKILEKEIIDILEYIELDSKNMFTYSLKIYKVFLSICTEIENNFKGIMYANNYNGGKNLNMHYDYFKLEKILKLSEYKVNVDLNDKKLEFEPFIFWKGKNSYRPLDWYQDYNFVKHNRSKNISKANLGNLMKSFCALYIILYCQFYEYANQVLENNLRVFMIDDNEDGGLILQSSSNIINIIKKPEWLENEKYDFDWEKIKIINEPYDFCNFN